jgi:hypothetical protein
MTTPSLGNIKVIDGDTVIDPRGNRVRLTGGDTAEVAHPEHDKLGQPGGNAVADAVQLSLDNGAKVVTGSQRDLHGRNLGDIITPEGNSLSRQMLANGSMDPGHWKSIESPDALGAMTSDGARKVLGIPESELDPRVKALFDTADTERYDALSRLIHSGSESDIASVAGPRDWRNGPDGPEFGAAAGVALERGVQTLQGSLYGFVDAVGKATGIDAMAKYGEAGVLSNITEAMRNPAAVASYEDIDSYHAAGLYAIEALGEFAPQMVATVGAGLVTGGGATLSRLAIAGVGKATARSFAGPAGVEALASAVGRKGLESFTFLNGAKAGAFLSGYAQNAGETQNQFTVEGIDEPGSALVVGVAKAALDYAGLHAVISGAVGAAGAKAAYSGIGQLAKGAAGAVVAASGAESVTEAAQTLMDEMAIKGFKPEYKINTTSIIDAALKGGIAGGGVAGAGHVLIGAAQMGAANSRGPSVLPTPAVDDLTLNRPAEGADTGTVAPIIPPSDSVFTDTAGDGHVAGNPLDGIGEQPVTPTDAAPAQATSAEPLADIKAQIASTPEGLGNWYTAENAEQAKQVAAEHGKETRDLADGSVVVGTAEVLAALPAEPTQADIAKLNGYSQTKEQAMADPAGVVAVEVRDQSGAVLRNQAVGQSSAEAVAAEQQATYPNATVTVTTPEAVVTDRAAAVENQRPAPVDEGDLRMEAAGLGIDPGQFVESSNVEDVAASRRVLMTNLGTVLDDSGSTVRAELAGRRIEALSDEEVGGLLDRLHVKARPSKFGSVKDEAGNESPAVEQKYRAQVAGDIGRHIIAKFAEKGVNLAPLASLLGVNPVQLERSYYTRGKDGSSEVLFKANVKSIIREKFKTVGGMTEALQQLPAAELHTLAAQLGVKVKGYQVSPARTAGKLNTAALQAAIKGHKPTTDTDASVGAPVAPLSERESAKPQPWQEKMHEGIKVAKELAGVLFARTEASIKKEGRHIRTTQAGITRTSPWQMIKSLDNQQRREVVALIQPLVGRRSSSTAREAFVDAVREAMIAAKGNAERKVAAENVYDEDGALIESTPTQAEALTEQLDSEEEAYLNDLIALPGPFIGDWSGKSKNINDVDSRDAIGTFLHALQRLVSSSEVFDEGATLSAESELRVNQALLTTAALQGLMPAGASPKRFNALIAEALGLVDADVREGGNTTATAAEALAGMAAQTEEYQTKVMGRRIANVLATDRAILEAAAEAGIEAETEHEAAVAYLNLLLDDDATMASAVAHIVAAVQAITIRGPLQSETLQRQHSYMFGKKGREGAERQITAQAEGAMDTPVIEANEDEKSEQSFFGALWEARAKRGSFRKGSKSIVTTEAMNGRNLQALPHMIHGHEMIEQFDMVALAMYGQAGEHAPSTPAGAMRNLLTNLGRAQVGPLTRGVEHPAIFDVTVLPRHDTVIFIDPVSGKGVTFGEASGQVRAEQREQTGMDEQLKRRDVLSAEAAQLTELMAAMRSKLMADIDVSRPVEAFALRAWADALVDPKYKRPQMTPAQTIMFERIGKRTLTLAMQKAVAADLDANLNPLGDATLKAAFSKLKSNLGELKKLSAQLREAGVFKEEDEFNQARREAAKDLGDQYDLLGTERAAAHDLRSSEGVMEEAVTKEAPDPTTEVFIRNVQYQGHTAVSSREQLDTVIRHAKEQLGTDTRDQQAPIVQRPAATTPAGKQAGGAVKKAPQALPPVAVRAVRGARVRRAAANRAVEANRPKAFDEMAANTPFVTDKPVEGHAKLEGAQAPTVPTDKAAPTKLTAEDAARLAPTPVRTTSVRGAAALANVVHGFTRALTTKGVPLPVMDTHITPRTLAEVQDSVDEADYVKVQEAWDAGGSFYLRNGDRALIVLRPKDRSHAELLSDLAHELGHAVKDQVWMDLSTNQRYELAKAFMRDTKIDLSSTFDDSLLHEWFADQFAQVALDEVAKTDTTEGSIARHIADLAGHIRSIWQMLTGRVPGVGVEYRAFAQSLFAGGFAHAEGQASNINAVVRFAEGANVLQEAGAVGRAVGQAKAAFQNGAIPQIGSRMFRMVISRIKGYSPELASMLFQQAGNDASGHGRAWAQQSEALRARMQSQITPVVEVIEAAVTGKAAKRLAVRQSFQDAATGKPTTEGGKQVRALMDGLAAQAKKDGLMSVQLEPGFTIAVFSREQVDKRRAEFEALLTARLGDGADVRAAVTRIVEGTGVIEGALAPGMPVGSHATTRSILEAIPFAELQAGGWLLDEPEAAMYHWIDGIAKRTAWDSAFGAHVDGLDHNRVARAVLGKEDPSMKAMLASGLMTEDGKVFDANAKYKALMDKVREQHGVSAAAEVQDMIDGAMGRHGQNMPGTIRRTYDAVIGWTGLTILAFSGLASIPELALPLIRGGGKVKLGDVFRDLGQARQFTRDMGIVMSDMADRVSWQLMGEQYQSPMMQKITHQFFYWNGNKTIVDFSRYMAVSVAMRYLQSSAESGDHGALHRLNIDAATVNAWVAAGRPAWKPGLPEAQQGPALAVADAINQFVGEATLRPSRFQATNWGNNPWMKIIWQLKHFLYTYGDTVLGGIWRETSRRWKGVEGAQLGQALAVATPALLFAVFVLPLAAAAGEGRDLIRRLNGQRSQLRTGNGMDNALGYLKDAFNRAGGLGPLNILEGMSMANEYNRSPILAISPVLAKLEYLADFGDGTEGGHKAPAMKDKVRSLLPVFSQNKALFPD